MKTIKTESHSAEIFLVIFHLLPVIAIWLTSLKIWSPTPEVGLTKIVLLGLAILFAIICSAILRNNYTWTVWFIVSPTYILSSILYYIFRHLELIGPRKEEFMAIVVVIQMFLLAIGIMFLWGGIETKIKENRKNPS